MTRNECKQIKAIEAKSLHFRTWICPMLLDFEDVRRILIVGCDMQACDELIALKADSIVYFNLTYLFWS